MGSLLGHPERHGDAMRAPWHPAGEDGWLGTRELPGYRAGAVIVRLADLPGVDRDHLYLDVLRLGDDGRIDETVSGACPAMPRTQPLDARSRFVRVVAELLRHAADARRGLAGLGPAIALLRENGIAGPQLAFAAQHLDAACSEDALAAALAHVLVLSLGEEEASATLDAFIDQHASRISSRTPAAARTRVSVPRLRMEPRGQHHDLETLYHELNASYFRGQICARITWAKRKRCGTPPRHHKSLRMGSYSVEDQLIRIHPTLDRPDVPRFYVAWIIYHEMLHQKHQIPLVAGRRCFHPPAFLAEERLFDEYERARRFEQQNLHRLLWY